MRGKGVVPGESTQDTGCRDAHYSWRERNLEETGHGKEHPPPPLGPEKEGGGIGRGQLKKNSAVC